MYYLYILESENDGGFYIGQTQNLSDRLLSHNSGKNISTKSRRPWKLYFSKAYETRSEAYRVEQLLKKKKSRSQLISWVESQST
jgi:putative endonuclease